MKNLFIQYLERVLGKTFAANIAKLLSGAMVGMAISFLAMPILSRLYTPDDYGLFGIITSFVGIFTAVASFRYSMAIILPKENDEATDLLVLSALGIVFTTLLSGLLFIGGAEYIAGYYQKPELEKWLWAVPVFIALSSIYQTVRYWITRSQRFGAISISATLTSSLSVGAKVLGGQQALGYPGLIWGQLFGQGIGTVFLFFVASVTQAPSFKSVSKATLWASAKKYKTFPLFDVPATLFNAVGVSLPVLGLGYFFSTSTVGLYSMAFLLLKTPIYLVSDALRQVFYQKATQTFHDKGNLFGETMKLTGLLFTLAIIPAFIFIFFATPILSGVLGEEWREAGIYASLLTPFLVMVLLVTPSDSLFPILNIQHWNLIWQFFSFLGTVMAIAIGGYIKDPIITVALLSGIGTFLRVIRIGAIAYITRRPDLWKDSYAKGNI